MTFGYPSFVSAFFFDRIVPCLFVTQAAFTIDTNGHSIIEGILDVIEHRLGSDIQSHCFAYSKN